MADRISGVGRVTVSDLKSMSGMKHTEKQSHGKTDSTLLRLIHVQGFLPLSSLARTEKSTLLTKNPRFSFHNFLFTTLPFD
jgi:hypothetical protein